MTRQNAIQTRQQSSSASPLSKGEILQRKCDSCGQHTIAGGECGDCGKKKSGLQRKLSIGASNDPLELEADRVADQVMSTSPNSVFNSAPPRIQRFTGQTTEQADMAAPASVDSVLSSPGSPLDTGLQQDMSQRFGHNFSRVRVHTDAAAARSAQEVNANAYTVGHNMVFGAGRYAPGTHKGRRLLAHELTHVVQQSGSDGISSDQRSEKIGPSVSPTDVSPDRLIQRAPPGPPASVPDPLILGSTDPAAETESLFHYGDLTAGKETLSSTKNYPRITNCDIAATVEDAAKYTGTPVRETVKFKYELKIERGYFLKNFKNVGTRTSGYSEFATDQPIPVKYFRKVATLLRGSLSGVPPVTGGGPSGGAAAGGGTAGGGGASAAKPLPSTVPGSVAQGAVEGAEGAATGAVVKTVVRGGLRFLGGAAIGAAIGLLVGLAYSYLTQKLIEADIANVLKNISADRQKRIQARIDALPDGKKKLARITLDYIIWRSTLGFFGPPPAYQLQSVTLVNVHPGNEELDFPASTEETPGEILLGAQKVTIRISYSVPIDPP